MRNIEKILSELNDFELANFAKFKMKTYMKETQNEIKEYLNQRNITEEKIEILIAENLEKRVVDGEERCPKCNSDKLRNEKVEWTHNINRFSGDDEIASIDGFIGTPTYKNEIECNVCGYVISDPNENRYKKKTISERIFGYILAVFNAIISK